MSLKSMLTTNMRMKLLSLLLAALLWLFVNLEAADEIEIPLSVSYLNTPSVLAVKPSRDSGCSVRIEGARILLLRQKFKGVSLTLDLSAAREGITVYSGLEGSVKLIKGVKALRVSPVVIKLELVSNK